MKNVQSAESDDEKCTFRGSNCCEIKFRPIYMNIFAIRIVLQETNIIGIGDESYSLNCLKMNIFDIHIW